MTKSFAVFFMIFFAASAALVALRIAYGTDPLRDNAMADCITENRGKSTYKCPQPLR